MRLHQDNDTQYQELESLDFSGSVSDWRPCPDSESDEEVEEILATLSLNR